MSLFRSEFLSRSHLPLVVLVSGALLAALTWMGVLQTREQPTAAFLIPVGESAEYRQGWRRYHAEAPVPLAADKRVHLGAGQKAEILGLDGTTQRLEGPTAFTPRAHNADGLPLLQSDFAALHQQALASARRIPAEVQIRVTSPSGVSRFLNPTVTWIAKPNTLYDVAVIDPADEKAPPRLLRGARPPVRVQDLETTQRPQLTADRNYTVLIRESVSRENVGLSRVLIAPDAEAAPLPSTSLDLLKEAVDALKATPYRSGDAWLALQQLPPPWRDSELGRRLRLFVSGELGVTSELETLRPASP